ncbi:hypothetical protein J3P85_03295 [Pseudomonas sp. Z1-12]|uniref:hypothetical protein n=1 Tax=Pseudomonas sp. Z1-12 TaxID=2817408 RepID=UPI003DA9DBC2
MPWNVPIPTVKMGGATLGFEDSATRTVLGESRDAVDFNGQTLPKKYLVDLSFALPEEEYINTIESKLKLASSAVREGCHEYWTRMKIAHANGQKAIGAISKDQIEEVLASGMYLANKKLALCDPRSPMGINWFLAVANYYLLNDPNLNPISFTSLARQYPFFRSLKSSPNFKRLIGPALRKLAGVGNDDRMPTTEILNRLLGLLSIRDCSAAAALLTIENPNFNSMALQQAKLIDDEGNSFYTITINGNVVFSVEKPRARARKSSSLSPISEMIMDDLIRSTYIIREKMSAACDERYCYLFLVSHKTTMGTTMDIDSKMNGGWGLNLYDAIYLNNSVPQLKPDTFTLSNIRNTEGIIEFLAKGSLAAMAKKLGNTIHSVIESYIPPWLIEHWCERLIRRFHQKLVIVANAKTPWLLPASDFTSHEQIIEFVKSMLMEGREGDAFTKVIEERFGSENKTKASEVLFINLKPDSLAALYAYENLLDSGSTTATMENLNEEEAKLVALARLMRCVAENPASSTSDISANIELQGESLAEFKLIHWRACELAKDFLARFRSATVFYKD